MATFGKDPTAPAGKEAQRPQPRPASGEMSMEARLLLTLTLMGLVLLLTPYFVRTTVPPPPVKSPPAQQAKTKAQEPPPAQPPASPPGRIAAESVDDHIVVETGLYRVRFSNRGAVAQSWVLKRYLDNNRKSVELVNAAVSSKAGWPFSIAAKGVKLAADLNSSLYAVRRSPDGLRVDFEFSDGNLYARKSFQFDKERYLIRFSSEIREQGRPVPHLVQWRGGFGDFTVENTLSTQHTLYYDIAGNSLEIQDVSVAKEGPASVAGRYLFAGLEDTYFAAIWLPPTGASLEMQTWSDRALFARTQKEEPHIGVALGGEGLNQASIFIGPKDLDLLRQVDRRLEQVVDFGWFWFLAKPLFVSLNYINDKYVHNYGWSIVLVTILINLLMLPLKFSNLKSMKKMAVLQPQIKAIQEKYASLSMRDPRRAQQQQEMMELYKKHGVNPLGGCLPMLLQIPFFFAFYKVLTVAIEMRGASWLWVQDLSQPEHLAIRVLPLATIATQFIMQKMTPVTTADPQQQRIMMLMPLMFIFIFYSVASGLVLYWLTGNVVGIVQQWFFNRSMAVAPTALPAAVPKKTAKK